MKKIPKKEKYTNLEIFNYSSYFKNELLENVKKHEKKKLISCYVNNKRDILVSNICYLNSIFKKAGIKKHKLCHSGKKIEYMKTNIKKKTILEFENNPEIYNKIQSKYSNIKINVSSTFKENLISIDDEWNKINVAVDSISKTLDESVYGHKNAKRQIERIIGQWIMENKRVIALDLKAHQESGKLHCKKGLAHCLKDSNGESRPFSFIAVGGASNGSTIAGHNYTYVGSAWGK